MIVDLICLTWALYVIVWIVTAKVEEAGNERDI